MDIETAPNLAHVWGLWQQNVAVNQIMGSGYILCWAAKWLGEPEVQFASRQGTSKKKMLSKIHEMMNQADAVVHYNGAKFDIPFLNQEFLEVGFNPPSPYKQIDLLNTIKSQFRFPSNKLAYVAPALGVGEKAQNSGHDLWVRCMTKDPEAWKEMESYNIQDVLLLEKLYVRLLPWIKSHPNSNLYVDGGTDALCPRCGNNSLVRRGTCTTTTGVYQRYQCKSCNSWSRDGVSLRPRGAGTKLARPA